MGNSKLANEHSPVTLVRRVLLVYVLVMFLTSIFSWYVYLRMSLPDRLYNFDQRPLFAADDQFRDLTNYSAITEHLLGGSWQLTHTRIIYTYPPPAAFVYKALLHSFPAHPVRPYLLLLGAACLAYGIVMWRAVDKRSGLKYALGLAIALTCLFGDPLLYTADRGNLEGVAWIIAAAALCFVVRYRYKPGVILLGVAAAIKPFVGLFLLLFVARRRYKEALIGGMVAGVLVLTGLVALGPNPWKAYKDLRFGVERYKERYVRNIPPADELRFDHSLMDGMKTAAVTAKMHGFHPSWSRFEIGRLFEQQGGWPIIRKLAGIYPVVMVLALCGIIAVFYRLPALNQLTALGVAVTLLPFSSNEYTLLHLYVPFGAWIVFVSRDVAAAESKVKTWKMFAMAIIYGLLFAPLTPLRVYASFAKMLLLIALLVVIATEPMRSDYFDADQPGEALELRISREVSV